MADIFIDVIKPNTPLQGWAVTIEEGGERIFVSEATTELGARKLAAGRLRSIAYRIEKGAK